MNMIVKFRESAKLFRNIRALCCASILTALAVALSAFDIPLFGDQLQLSIGYIAVTMAGVILGPAVGMAVGALTDVLQALLFPSGAYFPGFTLSALIAGFFYGAVLFRREKIDYFEALVARGAVNLVCNSILNSIWVSMISGKAMIALLPLRVSKNIALLPFEALIMLGAAKIVEKLPESLRHFK